jgi:hypothetical protein
MMSGLLLTPVLGAQLAGGIKLFYNTFLNPAQSTMNTRPADQAEKNFCPAVA